MNIEINDRFENKLLTSGLELKRGKLEILQINLGKLCNLACVHCHVEAGPTKTHENMDEKTAQVVVQLMDQCQPQTLDLTGGAPELNSNFKFLVTKAKKRNIHVIDRSNLTVLFLPDQETTAQFLADHQVEIIASLPCYLMENVDKQRGKGVFDDSIKALLKLNELGYGIEGSGLVLNLVYNPVGPHLPPAQRELEQDYKQKLFNDFGIVFNKLYTITNMPITRYKKYLNAFHQYEKYMELLERKFNPEAVEGLMCRNTLSVGWDGRVYDCDFNQALGMEIRNGKPFTIFDLDSRSLEGFKILTGDHCFGCTAGAGSSCQGVLKKQ